MARVKMTTYIDTRLRRAAKELALREGRKEYEVYEDALKQYFGWDRLDELLTRPSELTEDEAMRIAVEEVRSARAERALRAASAASAASTA